MAQNYPGLTEYGLSPKDFKDEQGNIRVPVDDATLDQETGIWVAGKAAIAKDSLQEIKEMRMAVSGNPEWGKGNMGDVRLKFMKDVSKSVWIRVRQGQGWAGSYNVVDNAAPDQLYEWIQQDKVIEVSPRVAHQLGISDSKTPVEVYWGKEPPADSAGEAKHEGTPVLGFALDGGLPKGISHNVQPNRHPHISQMPAGASMQLMQSATGMSQGAISEALGGRTDMRVGGGTVGSVLSDVRSARAAWATNTIDPSVRNTGQQGWEPSTYRGGGYTDSYGGGGVQGGQGPISYPDDVFFASYEEGMTGDLNMLYELQMAGMPQSAIEEYAKANGIGFDEAVRELHSQAAVDERWGSDLPWYLHMQEAGVFGYEVNPTTGELYLQAGNIADAARTLGIDLEGIGLENLLYKGDYAEGSREHYNFDYDVGWTQASYEEWSAERARLANTTYIAEDGNEYYMYEEGDVPFDMEAALDTTNQTFPDSSELTMANSPHSSDDTKDGTPWYGIGSPWGERHAHDDEAEQAPVTETTHTQPTASKYEDWQQEIANVHGFWGPDAYANWLMSDDTEEDAPSAPSAPSAPVSKQYEEDYEQWVDDINKASPVESGEPKADVGWAGMDEKEKLQKRAEHWYLQEQANIAEGW